MTFGCSRFIWNNCVESFNFKKGLLSIPALKEDYPFLKEVSCAAMQQKQRDFLDFKKQYFNKDRKSKVKRPKFRKKGVHDSFRLQSQSFKLYDKKIHLERIGKVSFVKDICIPDNSRYLSVTVIKNRAEQYFASVLVEQENRPLSKTNKTVGVDLGIKTFATLSDGITFEANKFFRENQSRLRKLQRHFSKKKKDSVRYKKLKLKIAKLHLKIANSREFYIHNITSYLVNNYDAIVVEDLNVEGMKKNRKLSKSISDAGFSMFYNQLQYKCNWYEKQLITVDRFCPSSKKCNACGNIKQDLTLKDRTYECEACGLIEDRDLNAAKNLYTVGITAVNTHRETVNLTC